MWPKTSSRPIFATLDLYCERVASAVGRLSIKVFGMEEGPGFELAHHLGRALQLTNILRDIDEDADIGRLYLPREYLFAAGFKSLDPKMVVSDPRVDGVCRAVAAMAHEHYDKAAAILAKKPKGRIATPRLMGAVYCEILKATEAAGFAPPRQRVSLVAGQTAVAGAARGLRVSPCRRQAKVEKSAPRLCDRRGACRPCRRHRAGGARHRGDACIEAAGQAGGRCRSYFDPALDQVIDNGNHLVLSGNGAIARYLDRIGARERSDRTAQGGSSLCRFEGGCALGPQAEWRADALVDRFAQAAACRAPSRRIMHPMPG